MLTNYLKLVRAPGLFSIISNVLASAAIFKSLNHTITFGPTDYLLLLLVSMSWFQFGMITNDLADITEDLANRPFRPMPSGAISQVMAVSLCSGWGLLALAIAFIHSAIFGLFSIIMAIMIISYNFFAKSTAFGPINMGLIRAMNWSLILVYCQVLDARITLIACIILLYTTIVTHISFYETETLPNFIKSKLVILFTMLVSLILFIGCKYNTLLTFLPLVTLIIAIAYYVYSYPEAGNIQRLVTQLLKLMVLIDACLLMAFNQWVYAIACCLLILCSDQLSKRIYLT